MSCIFVKACKHAVSDGESPAHYFCTFLNKTLPEELLGGVASLDCKDETPQRTSL